MAENPRKLYYSIKEVAQQINVTESLLRYWETEFPHLRPKTTGNRVRQYTEKDIEQIISPLQTVLFSTVGKTYAM